MASKLEQLLAKSISTLESRNKPLPPRPQRPQRLTNFFLPSSPKLPTGSRPWSPPPPSPKGPPSISGFTLAPTPPAPLSERQNIEREPPSVFKDIEEKMALVVLENTHLRQQNKVLYKQNSDYRELVQEYKACNGEVNGAMENVKAAKEAMELITQDVTANVKTFEAARARVRRAERISSREWKKFVNEYAMMGIEVDEVVKDVMDHDTEEITVYPYQDRNMI